MPSYAQARRDVEADFTRTLTALGDMNAQLETVSVKHMEVLAKATEGTRRTVSRVVRRAKAFATGVVAMNKELAKIGSLEQRLKTTNAALSRLETLIHIRLIDNSSQKLDALFHSTPTSTPTRRRQQQQSSTPERERPKRHPRGSAVSQSFSYSSTARGPKPPREGVSATAVSIPEDEEGTLDGDSAPAPTGDGAGACVDTKADAGSGVEPASGDMTQEVQEKGESDSKGQEKEEIDGTAARSSDPGKTSDAGEDTVNL